MKRLNYTFKNQGLGIFNDNVFDKLPFSLIENEYTLILRPSLKTKFWRFGFAFSKIEDFQFEPAKGRYDNHDLKFVEINVGDRDEDGWAMPNRIAIGSYHIDGYEGFPKIKETYVEYSSVEIAVNSYSDGKISIAYFSYPVSDLQIFPLSGYRDFK